MAARPALSLISITVDAEANKLRGEEVKISGADSKVQVFAIPTNEELAIARETKDLI